MKLAITGASGFIGRYVLAVLDAQGIMPIVLLRPDTPIPSHLRKYKIVHFDLATPPSNAFEVLGSPEILIHLAWQGLPNYDSKHHIEEEVPRHLSFLKNLVQAGLKNLLVTGTCFEYGMIQGQLSENMSVSPSNPYGLAKNRLRIELELLQKTSPFNLTWARLFYTYGDHQSTKSLYSQIKLAIANKEASFNMSAGLQLRDYMPVEELAKNLVTLALECQNIGVINVCSGTPISVRDIVSLWLKEQGWNISLNLGHFPYSPNEPMNFWGDNQQLKKILNTSKTI